MTTTSHSDIDAARWLTFRLGGELYATPLLAVREVVEMGTLKSVPRAKPFFMGVINVRGEVVSVVDLRAMLGHRPEESIHNALMIFQHPRGTVAVKVDRVCSVEELDCTAIEHRPSVKCRFPPEALLGIARSAASHLVTLVDLSKAFDCDFVVASLCQEGAQV